MTSSLRELEGGVLWLRARGRSIGDVPPEQLPIGTSAMQADWSLTPEVAYPCVGVMCVSNSPAALVIDDDDCVVWVPIALFGELEISQLPSGWVAVFGVGAEGWGLDFPVRMGLPPFVRDYDTLYRLQENEGEEEHAMRQVVRKACSGLDG